MWRLCKMSTMPTVHQKQFVEKIFDSWDPKIHVPCNYLQIFYMAALIDECGNTKHYPLAMFWSGISKNTRSSVIGKMDNGIPLLFSDSAMTSTRNKNRRATFKIQMKRHCLSLKAEYDTLFKNKSKNLHFY